MIQLCVPNACKITMRLLEDEIWEAFDPFLEQLRSNPWDPGVDCWIHQNGRRFARFHPDYVCCWMIDVPQHAKHKTEAELLQAALRCSLDVDVVILDVQNTSRRKNRR